MKGWEIWDIRKVLPELGIHSQVDMEEHAPQRLLTGKTAEDLVGKIPRGRAIKIKIVEPIFHRDSIPKVNSFISLSGFGGELCTSRSFRRRFDGSAVPGSGNARNCGHRLQYQIDISRGIE
jgi:hypothetical protein